MRTRVLLLALGIGALPVVSASAACSGPGDGGAVPGTLAQLEQDTGVAWVAEPDPTFGATGYLFPAGTPPASLAAGAPAGAAAMAFFARYGGVFQMSDPHAELALEDEGRAAGLAYAAFTQKAGAVSVYGTRLTAVYDAAGHLAFVSGLYVPGLSGLSTRPSLTPEEAVARARADVAGQHPAGTLAFAPSPAPALTVYPLGRAPALAYRLVVAYASDAPDGEERGSADYVVDASSGAVLLALPRERAQHAGKDVVQIVASGQGQLTAHGPFPALGTDDDGGGAPTAPYYLQINAGTIDPSSGSAGEFEGLSLEQVYVRAPKNGPVLVSDDGGTDAWDTTGPDHGSGVDAYYYVLETEAWWRARGRDGWDGKGSGIGLSVHDASKLYGKPCVNNAYWDGASTIHFCPTDTSKEPCSTRPCAGAASVDLGFVGHEFQHAVTDATLGLVPGNVGSDSAASGEGQSGSIAESLADVFGQFVSHDTAPYDANCIFAKTWVPPRGGRNLIDPHASPPGPGQPAPTGQPDALTDPRYVKTSYDHHGAHVNDGVPNKAWSLLTFGGRDETLPHRIVSPSMALGWSESEALYVSLLETKPVPPVAGFWSLANALDGLAKALAGGGSRRTAVDCAFYAVGVYDAKYLATLGTDPCSCEADEAGACDAGADAAGDARREPPRKDAGVDARVACKVEVPGDHVCETVEVEPSLGKKAVEEVVTGCVTRPGTVIGACSGGFGCCTICHFTSNDVFTELCYDTVLPDGGVPRLKDECKALGGSWTSEPVAEPACGATPAGPDAGVDAGVDAGADGDVDSGASTPPHC